MKLTCFLRRYQSVRLVVLGVYETCEHILTLRQLEVVLRDMDHGHD